MTDKCPYMGVQISIDDMSGVNEALTGLEGVSLEGVLDRTRSRVDKVKPQKVRGCVDNYVSRGCQTRHSARNGDTVLYNSPVP